MVGEGLGGIIVKLLLFLSFKEKENRKVIGI